MNDLSERGIAAMIGAAVGDALGWPQENRSSIVDRKIPPPTMAFRAWRRRGGGRFNSYLESIGSGEYSDDTQMICACARSLSKGKAGWYDWLIGTELPSFPLHQRGAGRALLAACRAWTAGVAPWQPDRDTNPSSYFGAGGNGGAMRILPHALAAAAADVPISRRDVFCDAATTHGHPRAVIGALVHAVTLRNALTIGGTLGYGDLIDALLDDQATWNALPDVETMPSGWLQAWSATGLDDLERSWQATVEEMTDLLVTARRGMDAGALSNEDETLNNLGCTGTRTVGSGTVSAAGAVFLASRSAANPRAGLLSAAFLTKADTDTLASMTASILAAIAGIGWLAPLDTEVQDSTYLKNLALQVMADGRASGSESLSVRKVHLDRFTKQLDQASPGARIELADGRDAVVADREPLESRTESSVAERFRLMVADGQTVHVVRLHRRPRASRSDDQLNLPFASDDPDRESSVVRIGVKLTVSELNSMRSFYQNVFGMSPTRSGASFTTFNDILALTAAKQPESGTPTQLSIYLEVRHIDVLWQKVQEYGVRVVDALNVEAGRRRFRCLDPEGNLLEVRDAAHHEPSVPLAPLPAGVARRRVGGVQLGFIATPDPTVTVSDDEFREAIAPTVEVIRSLATAVADVGARHGRQPAADSRAMAEIAAEAASYAKHTTWDYPVTDTHSLGGMTLFAASDYARTFAETVAASRMPVYGHLIVARSALEASVVSAWLNEPGIAPAERVKRGLCEQIYNAWELARLRVEEDADERVARWEAVAANFGWGIKRHRDKPAVDDVKRPSIPDGIDGLLMDNREGAWRIGRVQWSYLSAVSHVTWYGLRQAITEAGAESDLGPSLVSIGITLNSVRAQAVCILKALRTAATARFTLMGWVDEEWQVASRRSAVHERELVEASSSSGEGTP